MHLPCSFAKDEINTKGLIDKLWSLRKDLSIPSQDRFRPTIIDLYTNLYYSPFDGDIHKFKMKMNSFIMGIRISLHVKLNLSKKLFI
jgi:hypothetical protein